MIAANDTDTRFLTDMAPDQLCAVIAHACGLLAHHKSDKEALRVMQNVSKALRVGPPTMRDIADRIAGQYGYTLEELKQAVQRRRSAPARQHAMWEIYATGRYSNQQIANFFGVKDYSTVIKGRQVHEERMRAQA